MTTCPYICSRVFQMSAISRVFGLQLCTLAVLLMLYLLKGFIYLFIAAKLSQILVTNPLGPCSLKKTRKGALLLTGVCFLSRFPELSERHQQILSAIKRRLDQAHQDEVNDVTARLMAETAIKVESVRLETEDEWREKLDRLNTEHQKELQTMTDRTKQVQVEFI